jgi:hypothetical protein
MGVALARTQVQLPEGLLDWIRAATVYAGLEVYDVPVRKPGPSGTEQD